MLGAAFHRHVVSGIPQEFVFLGVQDVRLTLLMRHPVDELVLQLFSGAVGVGALMVRALKSRSTACPFTTRVKIESPSGCSKSCDPTP